LNLTLFSFSKFKTELNLFSNGLFKEKEKTPYLTKTTPATLFPTSPLVAHLFLSPSAHLPAAQYPFARNILLSLLVVYLLTKMA
jgi:hypothetical protein